MLKKKEMLIVLVAALVGIAGGRIACFFQKPYTEASQSFIVQNRRHAAQNAYDYEGYYTLQTANEAARTLTSWLTSPGGVYAVFRDADIGQPFSALRSLEHVFTLKSTETPFFEVRYRAATKEAAEKLSGSLEELLKLQLASFQSSDSLSLASSPLVSIDRTPSPVRNMFYGAFLAMALAVFGILFDKAMKDKS